MIVNKFFIVLIRLYKRAISPMLPPACRFTPSCSEYALEAFEKKGLITAAWMTTVRLSKCHPFHAGGYDPVDCVGQMEFTSSEGEQVKEPSSGCQTCARLREMFPQGK